MSKLKLLGDIVHGEKYEKNGETKWKNTQLGTLWFSEEKNEHVVKFLGQWCKVFPPKAKQEDFKNLREDIQRQAAPESVDPIEDEIPF